MKQKPQIFVLGMHRSGTSMLTRLLALAGAHSGGFADLLKGNEENPKGFWERKDVRLQNDKVLRSLGLEWAQPLGSIETVSGAVADPSIQSECADIIRNMDRYRPWVIKDPRMCLTFPVWRSLCEEPAVVLIVRHPAEVARSLQIRNGFPFSLGLALWEYYVKSSLFVVSGLPTVVVRYHEVLENPMKELERIVLHLNHHFCPGLSIPQQTDVDQFVDANLRRSSVADSRHLLLPPELSELWNSLQSEDVLIGDGVPPVSISSFCKAELEAYGKLKVFLHKESIHNEPDLSWIDKRMTGMLAKYRRYVGPSFVAQNGDHLFYRKLDQLSRQQRSAAGLSVIRKLAQNEKAVQSFSPLHENGSDWPLVSVIMPVFNREFSVEDSIRTVLEQRYTHFELIVCDDGSSDRTKDVIEGLPDPRIQYVYQENQGAGSARNRALQRSSGTIITYLDSDNFWHPRHLERIVAAFAAHGGKTALYLGSIEWSMDVDQKVSIEIQPTSEFDHERLLERNYIDLNAFAHRRELYEVFGGFDSSLSRLQDYDLVLKYTWLQDPLVLDCATVLYQRNAGFPQISHQYQEDDEPVRIIRAKVDAYFAGGLPYKIPEKIKKVSVIAWDRCRNHFAKPFAMAEALSKDFEVELIAFDFFDEGVFGPYKDEKPGFETKYIQGSTFPDFFTALRAGIDAIEGDVMLVGTTRFPGFGLALIANFEKSIPFVVEVNDLETVVNNFDPNYQHRSIPADKVDWSDPGLVDPYSQLWCEIMDEFAQSIPVIASHNHCLDEHYGKRSLCLRNVKDERVYDPSRYDRREIREQLGFSPDDRVILFGGLLRRHKGIHELVELVDRLKDERYKLLFVGSRLNPDQDAFVRKHGHRITVLPPQDREGMARINYASDLVILWLNPDITASHYQFPYKASDPLAMRVPVIANAVSDLGILGKQGYLKLVPFGDWKQAAQTIRELFDDTESRHKQVDAAHRLFLRQFSYAAARASFAGILNRVVSVEDPRFAVSEQFVAHFEQFYQRWCPDGSRFSIRSSDARKAIPRRAAIPVGYGSFREDESISICDSFGDFIVESKRLRKDRTCVLIPTAVVSDSLPVARLCVKRADHPVHVLMIHVACAERHLRLGTLKRILQKSPAHYWLWMDGHGFPGRNWLELAFEEYQEKCCRGLRVYDGAGECDFGFNAYYFFARSLLQDGLRHVKTDRAEMTLAAWLRKDIDTNPDDWTHSGRCKILNLNSDGGSLDGLGDVTHPICVDVAAIGKNPVQFSKDVCVIMPSIDDHRAEEAMRRLIQRSGMDADFVIAKDSQQYGFIQTVNALSSCTRASYLVYLAEDAFPGHHWLKTAFDRLETTQKGLLAFNCGKWIGRIAAFGMVRREWIRTLYGGGVFSPTYKAHRADNEITLIAKAQNQFVYADDAVLFEIDYKKDFVVDEMVLSNFTVLDKHNFEDRFKNGFGGLLDEAQVAKLQSEYYPRKSGN